MIPVHSEMVSYEDTLRLHSDTAQAHGSHMHTVRPPQKQQSCRIKNQHTRDLPAGQVAKTLSSQSRWPGFELWPLVWELRSHMHGKAKNNNNKIFF